MKNLEAFPNLTVKGIPKTVLSRCGWGKDDYSLEIASLPPRPPEPGEPRASSDGRGAGKPRSKEERRAQATLFDLDDLRGTKT